MVWMPPSQRALMIWPPPDGINVPWWVCDDPQKRTVMPEIITVGLDLEKTGFQVHGADAAGQPVLRKKLRRDQVLSFFGELQPCVVALEAFGGAHFWGREIGRLGHEVRLIPPAHVKSFAKRQKNDAVNIRSARCATAEPDRRKNDTGDLTPRGYRSACVSRLRRDASV